MYFINTSIDFVKWKLICMPKTDEEERIQENK